MSKRNEVDVYAEDSRCGYGGCKPHAIQSCANVKAYTANLSVILLFHIAFYTYFIGVMRTMEKRFGFRSSETGFLNSVNDIVQTCIVLFIGYLGGKAHKPRFLGGLVVTTAIASFLYALPYFIYGGKDVTSVTSRDTNMTSVDDVTRLCQSGGAVEDSMKCISDESKGLGNESLTAYIIVAIGCIFIGVGGSSVSALGFSYIDENVPKKDSSIYLSIAMSMYPWGPIIGFVLASLCTGLPETLTESVLSTTDPNYIGAWWLGFLIIGLVIFLGLIPLFLFPKHMSYYYEHRRSRLLQDKSVDTSEKLQDAVDNDNMSIVQQFKEFPRQFWKLLSNKAFVVHMLGQTCSLYIVVGVLIQQPRYLEVHFNQPAHMAGILSALAGATSGVCGNMLGGVIMRRLKLDKLGASSMIVFSFTFACFGTIMAMVLSCQKTNMHGVLDTSTGSLILDESCNMNCTCSTAIMQPICAGNNVTFFSPCHAGCHLHANGTFSDCSCIPDNVPVVAGSCDKHCSTLIPYVVVYFTVSFFSLMGRVPGTILGFRLVEEHMRSFSFGFGGLLINMLTFIPGPILFGALVDSTCLIWQDKCGKTGACFFYDTDRLRLLPHGVTLGVQFTGLLLAITTWVLIKRGGGTFRIPPEERALDVPEGQEADDTDGTIIKLVSN